MATLILRPVADVQLNHSRSSGSNGYSLISEAVADGESSYIYYEIEKNKSGSATSVFKMSGASSNKIRISSLRLNVNAKVNNSFDSAGLTFNLYFNGVEGASQGNNMSTSFANYSKTYYASDFGLQDTIFDSFDAANLQVHVLTSLDSDKNNALRAYVTQVYLEVTYEEVSDVYTCAAVAGENITSASVSKSTAIPGDSVTFTAVRNPGCTFDGWYTAASGGNRVSTSESYTVVINAPTTLYARATKDTYNISAVASAHCSASVNRSTAQYGDSAIFTAALDTGYDFDGWYTAASGGTKVSGNNPYTHTVTGHTTLYARATLHLSVISLDAGNTDTNHYGENQSSSTNLNSGAKTLANMTIYAVAVKWDLMSAADINNFNNGNFSAISSAARADYQTAAIKRQNILYSYWAPKLTINVPYGYTLGLYATSGNALQTSTSTTIYSEGVKYYWSTSNANNSVTGTGLTTNTWNAGFENYTTKSFMTTNDVGVVRIDNVTTNGNYYYNSFAYHDNQLHTTYGISSVSADAARNCTIDTVGIHATVQDSRFFFKEWRIGSENGTAVGANSADYTVPSNHHDYLTIGTSRPYTADMVMYAIADTNQQKWYPTAYGDAGVTTSVSQDWIVAGDNYTVTYSAEADEKLYVWKGWYRDAAGTDLVSTAWTVDYVPTAADQGVLYAKAEPRIYNITLTQSEGGTAAATVTSGTYNTSTVLQWTADDNEWYTFDYWSSGDFDVDPADADYYSTQLISPGALVLFECPEPNKYILANKTNITSYLFNVDHKYVVLWNDQLFINVPVHACRYERSYVGGSSLDYTLVLGGQDYGYPFGIYTVKNSSTTDPILGWSGSDTAMFYVFDSTQHNFSILSSDNPYTHYITADITIAPVVVERPWYKCMALHDDGCTTSVSVKDGHVLVGNSITFTCVLKDGYEFLGWYSDDTYETLITTDLSYTVTPEAAMTIYAQTNQVEIITTGIYIKRNSAYAESLAVYKKIDGAWVIMSNADAKEYLQNNKIKWE